MTELEASGVVDHPPPYIIFVVVFLFFLTGLLGFLVCHLLKKKGYRCRAGDMDDAKEEEKLGGNADDEDEENQDTVEQILKCIIENEANMEAFNEMFGNHAHHDPRLRKESVGGVPPHHHTVHSGSAHNSCHLCAQVRSKKGRRQSRPPRFKQRPGEQTVFSVGRFRVTHSDKKLHGGPNPLVSSGDQLDQSQDSEEPKEGGYNLRSMFKDVRPPSEGSTVNVGKRRKSLTIFGLRRGSDPVGLKVKEGTGRETGGIRFAIQQQPVVLEELLQAENIDVANGSNTKPGIKPETKPSKSQTLASPQHVPNILGSVNSPSDQSKDPVHALKDGSKHRPSAEPGTDHMFKLSVGTPVASAPSSPPIPSPALSEHSFKTTDKQGDVVEDKVLKKEEAYDPGPLQASTPIAPIPGSIPGFTPVIPIGQSEPCPSPGFSVTETPRDPSFSPDFGASLALKSGSVASVASTTRGDIIYFKEQELEVARTLKTEETTEITRVGILKTLSPVEGHSRGSALYSPTENRLSSLPLSPSSPLPLSSPIGSRINSVTIIKASPDSKREFSVVTLMEQEVSSTSMKEQKGAPSELRVESEKGDEICVSGVGHRESQNEETPRAEVKPRVSQEKDDMVEMEDIRDCKVTQVEEEERVEEELEKMGTI